MQRCNQAVRIGRGVGRFRRDRAVIAVRHVPGGDRNLAA